MDTITLHDMEFFAHHGCFPEEQTTGTYFGVDVHLAADLHRPAQSDCLGDTINYQQIYDIVQHEMQIPSKLLEHVAARILHSLHTQLENTAEATVTIRKLNPPLGGKVGYSAVTMRRSFN